MSAFVDTKTKEEGAFKTLPKQIKSELCARELRHDSFKIIDDSVAPVRNADELPRDQRLSPASKPKQLLERANEPSDGRFGR